MSSSRNGFVSTALWRLLGSAAPSRCSAGNWSCRCSKRRDDSSVTWSGTTGTSWTVLRADYGFVNSDLASIYKVHAPARDFDRVSISRASRSEPAFWGRRCSSRLPASRKTPRRPRAAYSFASSFCASRCRLRLPASIPILPPVEESQPRHQSRTTGRPIRPTKPVRAASSYRSASGSAFEKFDAIGVQREKPKLLFYPDEHEAKSPEENEVELDLDTTGQVAGLANSEFTDARQLGEVLATAEQCQECVVKQVFRYMSGRRETRADAP